METANPDKNYLGNTMYKPCAQISKIQDAIGLPARAKCAGAAKKFISKKITVFFRLFSMSLLL